MGEFGSDDCLSTKIGLGFSRAEVMMEEGRKREKERELNTKATGCHAEAKELKAHTSKLTIFTFSDPLQLAPWLALLLIDELLIMIGAAPLGGLGGNGGRLECESGQIGSESSRFLSCMYSSIKLSNFVSTSSTWNETKYVWALIFGLNGSLIQRWMRLRSVAYLIKRKSSKVQLLGEVRAGSIIASATRLQMKFYGQLSPETCDRTAPYSLVFQF